MTKFQSEWNMLLARARQPGFQTALVSELASMGHPVAKQTVNRWLCADKKRRQKPSFETGMRLLEAAARINP